MNSISPIREQIEKEFSVLEKNIAEALRLFQDTKSSDEESTSFILRHALFISVYSFMEYSLRKLTLALAEPTSYKRRVSEFDKVYQYHSFLVNEMKLDKNRVEEDWEKLNIFRDIRNAIVHYNATIVKNINPKSFQFIEEDPRIFFEEPRTFKILDDGLVLELIEVSKRFLKGLTDQCNGY